MKTRFEGPQGTKHRQTNSHLHTPCAIRSRVKGMIWTWQETGVEGRPAGALLSVAMLEGF